MFKHRLLNLREREIRLVRLEESDDDSSPVHLTLQHVDLDGEIRFNALSYMWGPESPTFDVRVSEENGNEGSFRVRGILHDFLLAARKYSGHWTSEWMWIDQVSIDQAHHDERCHQVAQMPELYSKAQSTIIWLGGLTALDTESLDAAATKPSGALQVTPEQMVAIGEELDHQHHSSDVATRLFKRLADVPLPRLLFSPYWRRLWVVQEIILARRAVVFTTTDTFRLADLFTATNRLLKEAKRHKQEQAQAETVVARLKWLLTMNSSTGTRLTARHYTWPDVLDMCIGSECSEPLDRIYAVNGLVHASLRIEPNYQTSSQELLAKVLEKQIAFSRTQDARILWPGIWWILEIWSHCFDSDITSLEGTTSEDSLEFVTLGLARVENILLVLRHLGLSALPPAPTHAAQLSPLGLDMVEELITSAFLVRLNAYRRLHRFLGLRLPSDDP